MPSQSLALPSNSKCCCAFKNSAVSFLKKDNILPRDFHAVREKNSGTAPKKNKGATSNSQEPIHFVFDFSEGETFSLYGTKVRVPRENRFIATCDHLNLRLFVNPAFEQYALQHACEIDGVLISGFHLLLENYPDGSTYKTIFDDTLSQLRSWKAINDKLQIHLEFGHFASKEIANSVFLKIANLPIASG